MPDQIVLVATPSSICISVPTQFSPSCMCNLYRLATLPPTCKCGGHLFSCLSWKSTNQWGPTHFCPRYRSIYTPHMQLAGPPFCRSCKSTLDKQLRARPIMSRLQLHPRYTTGPRPICLPVASMSLTRN